MKKFLSTALVAAIAFSATMDAQVKKTWDFTKGLSDETVANLNADATNWASNGDDGNGTVINWKNNAKVSSSSYLTANGVVIPELEGLYFDIGSNGANSIHVAQNKIRLTRKNTKITFPKLANGQKVTIVGRSANSTAVNRGIAPVQSYLALVEGTTTDGNCIFVGGGVDGSLGTYSFTWEVQTDATDSVDVQFTLTPDAGIDFTLFQIDNGDEEAMTEDPTVAYVYSGDIDSDPLRQFVGLDDYCTVTNITIESLLDGSVSQDSIESFEVVVLAPSAFSDESSAYINARLNRVPILNFTPSAILGYTKVDPALTSFTVGEDYADADLFLDMEYSGDNDNEIAIFKEGILSDNMVYGYTLADGSDFADDDVYATAGENSAIHIHGKKNAYMLIPFAVQNILANDDYAISDNTLALISNAVKYLRATKATVTTAMKPTVTYAYENGVTTATLKSTLTGAKIFYTIDGTEPTTASTRYTEPIVFTSAATLKAFVVAPSYNNSDVLTEEVVIKSKLPTPRISIAQVEGSSTITLSTSAEAGIYYSFNGQTAYDRASLYAEPIVITEPGTITAFSYADGFLMSDVAEAYVQVGGIPAVKDTLAHYNAGTTDWFDNAILYGADGTVLDTPTENWAAKAAYYFGKSAWDYYSTEVDRTETVYGEDGTTPLKSQIEGQTDQDSTITYYKPDASAVRSIKSATDTKWVIKTQGQQLTGETNIAQLGYVKCEGASAARYHDEAIDLIGGPATTGCLTLGGKVSGNPFTASIQTVEKYAAPFDVVVYANQGNSDGATVNVEIQVSADGETWTAIGDVKFAYTQRHIKKTRVHYSEAGEVYVRLAQVGGSTKGQICDIYVISTDGVTGIEAITANDEKSAKSQYTIDLMGRRAGAMVSGQMYLKDGKIVLMK
ncbi:MAG: chitobiase/beta-hexosaminidase C-terminal domain-containing protein [Bacteroidales bacterium]|nr:chitobiase/beta-hexosaminidase C-terminal domain-containing protein [Bacteroidales bacterium]